MSACTTLGAVLPSGSGRLAHPQKCPPCSSSGAPFGRASLGLQRSRFHGPVFHGVRAQPQLPPPPENEDLPSSDPAGSSSGSSNDNNEGQPRPNSPPLVQKLLAVLLAPLRLLLTPVRLLLKFLLPERTSSPTLKNMLSGAIFMLMVAYVTAGRRSRLQAPVMEVPYSQFVNLATTGNVQYVKFHDSSNRIYFDVSAVTERAQAASAASTPATPPSTSKKQQPPVIRVPPPKVTAVARSQQASSNAKGFLDAIAQAEKPPTVFFTNTVPGDATLIPTLLEAGVQFGVMRDTLGHSLKRILGTALALWLPLLPLFWIMRRMLDQRQGNKKPTKKDAQSVPVTTFADVAGVDSAKSELDEVVACLKDPARFAALNAKMPSGVLLCGPPGTGKTLLARAVAGEAGVPFFSASASEFVEMYVGRGAARVRELFAEAKKAAPAVVLIDELDAVGGKRGISLNDERDQTLNQLLTELDGFEPREGVLLLAATNRPEVLDPALLRPGRISRRITVPLPDLEGRRAILEVYLASTPYRDAVERGVARDRVADISGGFSGAELANVVNEAALLAARSGATAITEALLMEGVQRTRFGVDGRTGGPANPLTNGWNNLLLKLTSKTNSAKSATQT